MPLVKRLNMRPNIAFLHLDSRWQAKTLRVSEADKAANFEVFQMPLTSCKYSSVSNEKRKSLDLLVAPLSSGCIKMRLSVWDCFNTTAITNTTRVFWWPTSPQQHRWNYLPDVPSLSALVSWMKKIPPDWVPQWSASLDPQSSHILFWYQSQAKYSPQRPPFLFHPTEWRDFFAHFHSFMTWLPSTPPTTTTPSFFFWNNAGQMKNRKNQPETNHAGAAFKMDECEWWKEWKEIKCFLNTKKFLLIFSNFAKWDREQKKQQQRKHTHAHTNTRTHTVIIIVIIGGSLLLKRRI